MSEKLFLLTTSSEQKACSSNFNKLKEYAEEIISNKLFQLKTTTGPSYFFDVQYEESENNFFYAKIVEEQKNSMKSYDVIIFTLNIESVKVI